MSKYYHVADASYRQGQNLYCYAELEQMGCAPAWKWGDNDYLDSDVVCLFETLAEAEDFIENFAPDGILLEVSLPEDHMTTRVDEGYPAVYRQIDAQYIRIKN